MNLHIKFNASIFLPKKSDFKFALLQKDQCPIVIYSVDM